MSGPPILLLMETATTVCSVAICRGSEVLHCDTLREGYRHAENLMRMTDAMVQQLNGGYAALDAIAVSAGPGSYTGLRIGLSSAKGMAYALEKPLMLLSTLEVMAQGFRRCHPGLEAGNVPMLDARRMEVYTAAFDAQGQRHMDDQPLILDAQSYTSLTKDAVWAFWGDGAAKYRELCTMENAHFEYDALWDARDMAGLALAAYEQQQFADLAYCEPSYLKPFFTTATPRV